MGAWAPSRRTARGIVILAGSLLAASALTGTAQASDPWEFWPEFNAFVRLSPQTRLYFVTSYSVGKESPSQTLELAPYLDITLKPILRPVLGQEDWAKRRYLWARVGYGHYIKAESGVRGTPEDRGILSVYGRARLPAEVWLEGRTRTDLRWIGGAYSTRYRLRTEVNREFTLLRHPVTPYFNVEWFYDTRYSGWARVLYQAGPEITLNEHVRCELYLARQDDALPQASSLNAFGIVVKTYF